MKQFFTDEHGHGVGLLAAGNLVLSSVESVLAAIEPFMHILVSIGQVAVAAATVFYIVKKARTLRIAKPRRRKK